MPSRWIPGFVVYRLTGIGPMRVRVHTLASALFWARHLRERWHERTWIERAAEPAHRTDRVDDLIEARSLHES